MKKINAVSALITDLLLALHMWIMTYSLFTGWYDLTICKTLGHILCGVFALHAALTICIFFFCHDGTDISCKKQNISTIMQRVEAILMLILIHSHVNAYRFMATGEQLTAAHAAVSCVLEVLLILAVSLHTAFSSSKAFITLGIIRTERARTVVTGIFTVVFGASGLAALVAVIRFFVVI